MKDNDKFWNTINALAFGFGLIVPAVIIYFL